MDDVVDLTLDSTGSDSDVVEVLETKTCKKEIDKFVRWIRGKLRVSLHIV